MTDITHPAKYSPDILSAIARLVSGCSKLLDPFGGTGKIFELNNIYPDMEIQAVEIEPEWAEMNPRTTLGDALNLPWKNGYFDAIATSPTYGNRMADSLLDGYKRITYAAALGRKLDPNNSGNMQWGDRYRYFHAEAWIEARRVLCPGGVFILNIKNHIRAGVEQDVTGWHIMILKTLGFTVVEHVKVPCPSMRFGQNSNARVDYESVIKFKKKE